LRKANSLLKPVIAPFWPVSDGNKAEGNKKASA